MQKKIISKLKEQYKRELRKQVVKSILNLEKNNKDTESSYKIVDQIFAYVISELQWKLSDNSNNWDDTPLKIMSEVFPKIETTKWFKYKKLTVK